MYRGVTSALVAGVCALGLWACSGDAPTTPAAPTPTVVSVSVTGIAPVVGANSQLSARATMSSGTTQDVTSQAMWQSSSPSIATVNNAGLVTATGSGESDVSATYQTVRGSMHLSLQPPAPITFTISGTVTDATSGGRLSNAVVNLSGRETIPTDAAGAYAFANVSGGPVTLTAAATGYQTASKPATVSSATQVDFALARATAAPAPAPVPSPSPSPSPPPRPRRRQGRISARWRARLRPPAARRQRDATMAPSAARRTAAARVVRTKVSVAGFVRVRCATASPPGPTCLGA